MAELINLVKNMGDRLDILEQGQPQRVQALILNEPEQQVNWSKPA